jgi:putative phosphoribosyl transferase
MNDQYRVDTGRFFVDREDAGRALTPQLRRFEEEDPVVLGIPRGGVPVAAVVARELEAELDVVVARKVGAPGSKELAIGAVTANGGQYLDERLIRELRVGERYLEETVRTEMEEARRREDLFRGANHHIELAGRTVIIVDDGLATGSTMRAAVRSVRQRGPKRLIVAIPVGAPESCEALRPEVDELVCLYKPEAFWAVGFYYRHFRPVPDEEVTRILTSYRAGRAISGAEAG